MALEPDFGIEITLILKVGESWEHLYTYYNHGLEPPFGGVKSGEIVEEIEWSVAQIDRASQHTETWLRQVRGLLGLPMTHDPDLPLKYVLKVKDDEEDEDYGNVIFKMEMETLDVKIEWKKVENIVVFYSRPSFDLSWAAFLFYNKAAGDFVEKIKEQS